MICKSQCRQIIDHYQCGMMLLLLIKLSVLLNIGHCVIFDGDFAYKFQHDKYYGYSVFLELIPKTNAFTLLSPLPWTGVVSSCTLLSCENINVFAKSKIPFFGAAITGTGITNTSTVICNPQYANDNYRTNGICIFKQKTYTSYSPLSDARSQVSRYNHSHEFLYTHGQLGFSAKYVNNDGYLFGAPGVLAWKGTILKYTFDETGDGILNPERKIENFSYLGYSVEYGTFYINGRRMSCAISGAPRGSDLYGEVLLFRYEDFPSYLVKRYKGEQIGSYFGASLLVSGKDLLIGAPMQGVKLFDEGCVFIYSEIRQDLLFSQKLCGSKAGGRFGTAMANLGPLTKEITEVIAISAPYEDQTSGCVYIYAKIEDSYQEIQKIYGKSVYKNVRGFGYSFSNALDVDANGYRDIAVGAHISGHATILRSRTILQYQGTLEANVSKIQDDVNDIQLEYCFKYSGYKNTGSLDVVYDIISDDRVVITNFNTSLQVPLGTFFCTNITVHLSQQAHYNPNPLQIKIENKLPICSGCPVVYPTGSAVEKEFPSATGCGSDGICTPNLVMSVTNDFALPFVIGSSPSLAFVVDLSNSGETAYLLKLNVSVVLEFTKIPPACTRHEHILTCDVSNRFVQSQKKQFRFELDVQDVVESRSPVEIRLVAACSGEGAGTTNNLTVTVPLRTKSELSFFGYSTPEYLVYKGNKSFFEVIHEFVVFNKGPSPLYNEKFLVELPHTSYLDGEQLALFDVKPIEQELCVDLSTKHLLRRDIQYSETVSHHIDEKRKLSFSCEKNGDVGCKKYLCNLGIAANHSRKYQFSVVTNMEFIVHAYQHVILRKDILIIESKASYKDLEPVTVSSIFYRQIEKETVSWWIWICAISAAVLILILISYVLYKAKFFSRPMRQRLVNEEEDTAGHGIMNNEDSNIADSSDDNS